MYWSALVVVVVLYAVNWYFKTKEFRDKLSKIKSEPCLPLLGHVFKIGDTRDLLVAIERMWLKLGKERFLLKLGPFVQVIITHPDDIEVILSSPVLIKKNDLYKPLKDWVGEGLVTSEDEKWRIHRKLLTPAFHFKVLESYVPLYNSVAKDFINNVLEHQHEDVDTFALVGTGNIKAFARSALGLTFSTQDRITTYQHNVNRLFTIMGSKMFTVWKQWPFLYNFTSEYKEQKALLSEINSIILEISDIKRKELKDVIEALASGKTTIEEITTGDNEFTRRKMTFIEIILLSRKPNGEPLTPQEIYDEMNTFVIAGYETTTKSICFHLYALAQHPEMDNMAFS